MRIVLSILVLLFSFSSFSQSNFSLATDGSMLRNFDGVQKFTVFGQTVQAQWHIDPKSTFYSFVTYHLNGKFSRQLVATARQPGTVPQRIVFHNHSAMRLRQLSVGIRRFIIGDAGHLEKYNAYVSGGFGLMFGRITNTFNNGFDTSLYNVEGNISTGIGKFKRLTFDIIGGVEIPIGYEIFFYTEARVFIPTSDFPSNFMMKSNDAAPFLGSISLGLRLLFNNED